ncbi:MAG: site-specific integrase [Eubacteriales bacterium]
MMKQIKVKNLCDELEIKLINLGYSEDSMRRYRKVFQELEDYTGDCNYSQSIGTDFLVQKFNQLGGFVKSGEHSKNQMYYFRVIRSLAEYYNFGTLFRRHDFHGEIIWPEPFKEVTEGFIRFKVEYQCSASYVRRVNAVVPELILLLDSANVHNLNGITPELISRYINSLVGIAPVTIAGKISILRQYFKYAYLNGFVEYPIEYYLPHAPQRTHTKLPTIWTEEQIESLITAIDTTNPVGKRDYAMMLVGARLGLRIGDITNLKFSDIDWDKKEISITQRKTKEALNLPLPNDVGWAIIDYIKNGRPITDYENIFVVHNAPYMGKPFVSTLWSNFHKALKRAGIQTEEGKRTGWHSLRHSLATNLLQNNVGVTTISDILGHADPQVAKHYLRVEINGLRKCALEVEVCDYVKK